MTGPIDVQVETKAKIETDGVVIPSGSKFTAKLVEFVATSGPQMQPVIFVMLAIDKVDSQNYNGMIIPLPRKSVVLTLAQKM